MNGICKFNKMINCYETLKCEKCSWNPTYYEVIKKEKKNESAEAYHNAMLKQISKRPLLNTETDTPVCKCYVCGKELYLEQKYCDECGQKIDWR